VEDRNKKIKLVLVKSSDKSGFRRVECKHCGGLLFMMKPLKKAINSDKIIEIKCKNCKRMNVIE
jgi:hypothetical protein